MTASGRVFDVRDAPNAEALRPTTPRQTSKAKLILVALIQLATVQRHLVQTRVWTNELANSAAPDLRPHSSSPQINSICTEMYVIVYVTSTSYMCTAQCTSTACGPCSCM
ncbi:unnamed protein product [Prorocentrum cordatum]|uniref:Uncharacterized protein n=1 Tax=Prorocentrum cordatum TaxID=2364126 RepID=A0ABN9TPG7_9DINO|nr:unnamed protein product [Polarella glacialis]